MRNPDAKSITGEGHIPVLGLLIPTGIIAVSIEETHNPPNANLPIGLLLVSAVAELYLLGVDPGFPQHPDFFDQKISSGPANEFESSNNARFCAAGGDLDKLPEEAKRFVCPITMQIFDKPTRLKTNKRLGAIEWDVLARILEDKSPAPHPLNRAAFTIKDLEIDKTLARETKHFVDCQSSKALSEVGNQLIRSRRKLTELQQNPEISAYSSLLLLQTLNLSHDATVTMIKKAFKKKALQYHPDKTQHSNSTKWNRILIAYQLLLAGQTKPKGPRLSILPPPAILMIKNHAEFADEEYKSVLSVAKAGSALFGIKAKNSPKSSETGQQLQPSN